MSSRIRSEYGSLAERVRRRPTHCVADELHRGIVLSWSSGPAGVKFGGLSGAGRYGDEDGVLHVGPLPAEGFGRPRGRIFGIVRPQCQPIRMPAARGNETDGNRLL